MWNGAASTAATFIARSARQKVRNHNWDFSVFLCLCGENGYATLRPTAGAIMRNSSISLAN